MAEAVEIERQHVTGSGLPKKGWRVKKHAVLVAKAMQDQGKHVEVYRCSTCREWHVGRQRRVAHVGGLAQHQDATSTPTSSPAALQATDRTHVPEEP